MVSDAADAGKGTGGPRAASVPAGANAGASVNRARQVMDALLAAIHRGEFARGEPIRETEIAARLGVSRTPVREALHRLRERGLLERTLHGLVVVSLPRPQIIELYEMRAILEGSAARFAAENATAAELEAIRHHAARFAAAGTEPILLRRINGDFHEAINAAAHNRYLTRTLAALKDSLELLTGTTLALASRREGSIVDHAAIAEALTGRDPAGAEAAARRHVHIGLQERLRMMFTA